MIHENTCNKEIKFNGAKGLVFIGDKIVVYRRDNNTPNYPFHIDLPGGGREEGESPFDTFKREVKEEFGLNVEKEDIIFTKKYQSVLDPSQESYFLVTGPLNCQESDIVFGDEGLEFMLMSLEEFVTREDGVKGQQIRVSDYIDFLKEPK